MTTRVIIDGPGKVARDSSDALAIFRLVPTASRNDRRFARDAFYGEVVVRASSPEDARAVASEAEAASAGTPPADSPFRDETRYSVVEVTGAGFLCSGKRGLIAGRFVAKSVTN